MKQQKQICQETVDRSYISLNSKPNFNSKIDEVINYINIIRIDAFHATGVVGTHLYKKGDRRSNFVKNDGINRDLYFHGKKVLVAIHIALVAGSLISLLLVLIWWHVCKCLHNQMVFISIGYMICSFHVTFQFFNSIHFWHSLGTALLCKLSVPASCNCLLKPKSFYILLSFEYLFSSSLIIRLVMHLLLHPWFYSGFLNLILKLTLIIHYNCQFWGGGGRGGFLPFYFSSRWLTLFRSCLYSPELLLLSYPVSVRLLLTCSSWVVTFSYTKPFSLVNLFFSFHFFLSLIILWHKLSVASVYHNSSIIIPLTLSVFIFSLM